LEPDHLRVLNASGDRFIFGRPFGDADAATKRLAAVFEACGIRADTATDIVIPLWEKLLGNVVLNPLSALTGGTAGSLLASPAHFATLKSGMEEARAVARAWGLPPGSTPSERLARTARVAASGPLRTSMLQDREAGRPLEIEPILGTVRELARRRNVPTPTLDRLYAEAIRVAISSLPRKPPCLQKSF
jgi:2-dehydropantoate 2-reductase